MNPLPLSFCKTIKSVSDAPTSHHVLEPKLDGYRLQVVISDGAVRSFTRTEHDATGKMPAVETAMRDLASALDGTVLDGEAVYLDDSGCADFHFTASVMGSGADKAATKQKVARRYVSFVAFDIMFLMGQDVRHLPLSERRALLEKTVEGFESPHVVVTEQAPVTEENHRRFTDEYGEGSVVKDVREPYRAGRTTAMLKLKKVAEEDVIVMGFEPGKGKFEGQVGAVKFGQIKNGELVERGQCSGMDDATRLELTANLPVGAVLIVTHNGVLANGGFRHPQWKALRTDKLAEDCVWTEDE